MGINQRGSHGSAIPCRLHNGNINSLGPLTASQEPASRLSEVPEKQSDDTPSVGAGPASLPSGDGIAMALQRSAARLLSKLPLLSAPVLLGPAPLLQLDPGRPARGKWR